MSERTVILYTFSKRFAMTGWRLGCAAGPPPVIEAIAKLNTNDESCTTHFIQHAGIAALRDPSGSLALLEELRRRRDATARGLADVPGIEFAVPEATFYLFPRVAEAMERVGHTDVGEFATAALHETGMSFCTRHHFGRPLPGEDDRFIRLAYSGIGEERIERGLQRFAEWIDKGAK
ncbi:MAG: aminotransferase class I/II-fold pyridoxal phosphate-dependent enzyme, partial [Ilumatobacteraceae bacterium]